MRIGSMIIGMAILSLAACGQPATPTSSGTDAVAASATPATPAEATPAAAEQTAPTMDVSALPAPYNTADVTHGQQVFAKCTACHAAGPGAPNRVGPSLHGMFDRKAGKVDGFVYSDVLAKADFTWEPASLDSYLADPRGYLPGNRMTFIGLKNEQDRIDVIAYLLLESRRTQ